MAARLRSACATRLLPLLYLLTLPTVVEAQFTFTTNNGAITITGYTGPGGGVTIPSTTNGWPVTALGDAAFQNVTSLASVTIADSVTNIGNSAFYHCTGLSFALIGTNVYHLGDSAFFDCSRLQGITLPDSLTIVGNEAFALCSSLAYVSLGNGVTSIGYNAFGGCSMTSVSIPGSVTNVGAQAFLNCNRLGAITVDALNSCYSSTNGVLFDKNQATLIQCPGAKAGAYAIPDTVIWIGDYAFASCTSLTNVAIPNSVTSIGIGAFQNCTGLTCISIPSSVTNLAQEAFAYCYGNLTRITIPDSVTCIGRWAFENCYTLTNVTIGNGLTDLGDYAFYGCPNLAGVYFRGDAPSPDDPPSVFAGGDPTTVYWLPGTTGWGTTFGGRPTALWFLPNPLILTTAPNFGVQTNQFGFIISWATNVPVVVEASTNLAKPTWYPISTNTLTNGSSCFSDPQCTNYPGRFFRLRSP